MIFRTWAKVEQAEVDFEGRRWLSLTDHAADVATAFEAIFKFGSSRAGSRRWRTATTSPRFGGRASAPTSRCTTSAKSTADFQARRDPKAPIIGHVVPGLALLYSAYQKDLALRLADTLMAEEFASWGALEPAVRAVAAHHGQPITQAQIEQDERNRLATLWAPGPDYDPIAALIPLAQAIRNDWFPAAFQASGPPLPETPRFWHAVAGLVMLADWIGSNQKDFPLYIEPATDRLARIEHAREIAPRLLDDYGFDPASKRKSLPAVSFASVSKYPPRPVQEAVGKPEGQIVILEAETGSGKTEAALYRFARLFERGEVDGLYFALPTRVAAKSLEGRIRKAVRRMFRCSPRPAVILAVPGYAKVDGVSGKPLPDFEVLWDDNPDSGAKRARWAAEHPKRFLAGTIAVGTIDQALLGAIQVRHAHMRSSSLLRHLLVVDEVHASDIYMERLLASLLDQHTRAGGHALLLSATLGSTARRRLLGLKPCDDELVAQLETFAYPAISTSSDPDPKPFDGSGRTKECRAHI